MGSVLVAVRSGLIDALAQETGFSGVECSYAYRKGRKDPRESCWTIDGRPSFEPASMRPGKTFSDETGTFSVRILVRGIGQAQEDTSARAIELGDVVLDFVATHANWWNGALGPTVQTLTVQGDGELVEAFNDLGTLAELTIPIRYTARLT